MQRHLSGKDKNNNPRSCLSVALEQKQTVMHYQPQKSRAFLKIVLAVPNLVAPCRGESWPQNTPRQLFQKYLMRHGWGMACWAWNDLEAMRSWGGRSVRGLWRG
jgi:hypothetical protein